MPGGRLLVEHLDGVTTLSLARPEVHNAIDAETAGMLARAIHAFARDDQARVLVVTGEGTEAFCAGADLNDVDGLLRRPGWDKTGPLGFSGLEPGKPRLAAIEGHCVGGGIEFGCWCDIRIAGEGARFGALNRRVGVPWVDGGTKRLPRVVGLGNALYIMETGEEVGATDALRMGLVQEVVPTGMARARAGARRPHRLVPGGKPACGPVERNRGAGVPLDEGLARE